MEGLLWVVVVLVLVVVGYLIGSITKLPNGSERYTIIFSEKMINMLKKIQISQNVTRVNALRNSVVVNFLLIEELEKNPAYQIAIINKEKMEKAGSIEEMGKAVITIVKLP